jgi:hypothetical protein
MTMKNVVTKGASEFFMDDYNIFDRKPFSSLT